MAFLQKTQFSSLNKYHEENSACSPKQQIIKFSSYLLQELPRSRNLNHSNTLPSVRVKTIKLGPTSRLTNFIQVISCSRITIHNQQRIHHNNQTRYICVYRCALHIVICILTWTSHEHY
jgi:hypothetical protein